MTITIAGSVAQYNVVASNSTLVLNAGTVRGSSGQTYGINFSTGTLDLLLISGTVQGNVGIAVNAIHNTIDNVSGYVHGLDGDGFLVKTGPTTIINGGRIETAFNTDVGVAIVTAAGGSVITNLSTGTISGPGNAIYGASGDAATVVNYGLLTMNGSNDYGPVGLYGGGDVFNKSGGVINAAGEKYGVSLHVAGTITNAGTIENSNYTAIQTAGGLVDNYSNGIIDGSESSSGVGVSLTGGGTLINAGTIKGGSAGDAVKFSAVTGNRLIDYSTGVFTGVVYGGNNGSVLELHSSASAGTLSNVGVSFTGFGTIQFDAGSHWLAGGNSAGVTPVTFSGFGGLDTINVTGFTAQSAGTAANHQSLTLTSGASHVTLHFAQSISSFSYTTGAFGTDVTTPCYLAGTRIRTDRGEIPVEQLAIGDYVITIDGSAKRIKWIGKRAYSSAFAAGNRDIIPILIKQGALGNNLPNRDLYVSPLHAMLLDGVLIQAEHLVNGESILRCPHIDPIRYFHIELDQHDVIFAEGAAAETFVDCDSRGMFHNSSEFAQLYPDDESPRWAFCAPRIESGPLLEQVRRVIDLRAGLTQTSGLTVTGPLQGNLDGLDGTTLTGWAFDPTRADSPVMLEVLDGDGLVARVTANRFRGDLEAAGIGDGRHGFELRLARALSPHARHEVRIRRVTDGRELPGSPLVIEPHDDKTLLADASKAIEVAADVADDPAILDTLMDTLLNSVDHVRRLRSSHDGATEGDRRLFGWAKGKRQRPKRALIIDDHLPRRDQEPGSNAILSHIAALRTLGWQVEFVAVSELSRGDDAVMALKAWGVTCHRAPLVASVEEVLRRNGGLFDLVYLHRLAAAEAYAAIARTWQPRAQLVYSVGDLHHLRVARQAVLRDDAALHAESQRLRSREFRAMRMVDSVVTHARAEAEYLAREAPNAPVHLVPWAPRSAAPLAKLRKRHGIAFIGDLRHAPNLDAMQWLAEDILPRVWQRDPDMRCLVAGGDLSGFAWLRQDPRIELVDPDSRLDRIFDRVRLTVAPLRFGAGVAGQVLDSLAAGLPCVMAPIAALGIELNDMLRSAVTDDPAEMADLICDLHHQPVLHGRHARAGLSLVRDHYTEALVAEAMASVVGPGMARPIGATKVLAIADERDDAYPPYSRAVIAA